MAVLRGSDEVARNKLLGYFKGDREVEYTSRQGNRASTRDIWVLPWYLGTPADNALRQQVNADLYPSVSGFITNFGFVSAPPVAQQMTIPGLLSDRAAITIQRNQSGVRKTSELTGRKYLDYDGQSVVVPFGRSTSIATGGPQDAFQVIFGRVKAASASNLCTFIPANYGVS